MQFLPIEVGDRDLVFPQETFRLVPFTFPAPVSRVHVAVQALYFHYPSESDDLRLVRIEPRVEFDPLASTTGGSLRVNLAWKNDTGGIGGERLATFQARFLVVGE